MERERSGKKRKKRRHITLHGGHVRVRTYVDTNDESCCVPLAMARYVYNSKQWSQVVEIEREGERERSKTLMGG